MATQQTTSRHLGEARRLLDELSGEAPEPQVKATAAVAHSILVLAEQVAASRLILAQRDFAAASSSNNSSQRSAIRSMP